VVGSLSLHILDATRNCRSVDISAFVSYTIICIVVVVRIYNSSPVSRKWLAHVTQIANEQLTNSRNQELLKNEFPVVVLSYRVRKLRRDPPTHRKSVSLDAIVIRVRQRKCWNDFGIHSTPGSNSTTFSRERSL
jgi:hypothetical protein